MGINKGYLTANTSPAGDEVFTPEYAVKPILKYLKRFDTNNIVWCPFDLPDSNFVKMIKNAGYTVICSHIETGEDFFEFEPESYDIIISNPPFSKKDDVIKRLYELNKPYAMLLPLPTLQGQRRFAYIKDCQALIFDKRINYSKDKDMTELQKGVSFASIYLCRHFLPENLIFEELEKE